jgi:hypothetical protein
MKIHAPQELAEAVAALLDLLARNVPEIAAECVTLADRLRAWAKGPTTSAGPTDPIDPPKKP